ncbi:unnamed protein product [Schistocephalus solidus]|uniref:CRAL-TRIO domain-containing protein n=1 Tax=Schistocephalus solidus TaxID=70667 RepID=A0A183TH56_SCHSO|nr:unnamed protein product [Schistocephalus solidus]
MPKQYPYTFYNPEEPLPEILVKRASKELGEVQGQVGAHLESFRRWLSSMPHLKCRTDDAFLLAFLRHAKFNHSKAQKRLDNFCTFRTSESVGAPSWFNYEQDRLDIFMDFVRTKLISVLGFTQEGVMCLLMKAALPYRIKKLIYLNMPTFFELFFKAASVWLNEKTKSKILMLQKDLTPAYESVPGLEELMPAEYNGGNCSFEEICEKNIKEFSAAPKNYLDFGISVDEAKRPSDSKNLMRVYKDLSPELMGISGNYRRAESMSAQAPYTFFNPEEPLTEILVKRASKELGEVQGQVGAHLESFRRWLSSMPHLKCRTGCLKDLFNHFHPKLSFFYVKFDRLSAIICTASADMSQRLIEKNLLPLVMF